MRSDAQGATSGDAADAAVNPASRQPVTIALTGGGTAGHVTPHFALLPLFAARGWQVYYIGSAGLEKSLVEGQGVKFYAIATGKLRRYLSWRNFADLFKVALGCLQALAVLSRRRPAAIFSKGGFVAVPVAWAAWLLRIPVVSHESDVTPGLATRLIAPIAKRIVYTFPETGKYLPQGALQVGSPVRPELLTGSREAGQRLCGFAAAPADAQLPTFLVMGGSQGAQRINTALLAALPWLTTFARVIHLTGAGKALDFHHPRYAGFEFVHGELKDLFAACDFVVSRAGANSIFEILALRRPMLLIPLEQGSRGDQLLNANSFVKAGWAQLLRETQLEGTSLRDALTQLMANADVMRAAQSTFAGGDAAANIVAVLTSAAFAQGSTDAAPARS